MADPITRQQLEDASVDADNLGDIVSGAADLNGTGLVSTRTGGDVKTIRRALADIEADAENAITVAVTETTNEIILGVTGETASRKRRFRWERLLAAFASGKIPRGLIDLADYGITDWPNPYNVLLYWTGSCLYPLAKIDADFNWGWADSDIMIADPSGDFYHSVDIVKMQDPALDKSLTLTEYHSSFATGTDDLTAGRGASAGNPFKTANYALTQAKAAGVPFHIFIYGDLIGLNNLSSATSMTIDDGLVGKITFVPTRLSRSYRAQMREGMTKAMWAWTNPAPGVYRSNSTTSPIGDAMKKAFAMFDALNVNDEGVPIPLKYLGGVWANEAAAQAAVAALPGSFAWYGTTGAGLILLVHLIDGREPDPETWWHAETALNTTWLIGEGSKLYIENMGTAIYHQGALIAGVRARPIVVDVGTRVEHTGEFWVYNGAVVGASGNGVQVFDIGRGGMSQMDFAFCNQDAENLHSFYSTSAEAGNYMHWFTTWIRAFNIGYLPFGNIPAPSDSNQVVSAHDQIWATRWNVVGGNTRGPVLYDVLGAQTLNINVHVADPRQPHETEVTPQVAFACNGALGGPAGSPATKIRLLHCSGKVPATRSIFWVRGGGSIEYAHQIGRLTSTIHGTGGTVTDVLPA
jgi:hypothetical protein